MTPDVRALITHDEAYRDRVLETGFWLAVVMLLVAVAIGVLLELFLPALPLEPVSTNASVQRGASARDFRHIIRPT